MIYELRIYHIHPGKMSAIHQRFESHTLALFKKHGMDVMDFWEDITENRIYYTMEHPDLESRNQRFSAFIKDPEWIRVKEESEKNGAIVEKVESFIMNRVPYSPLYRG